MLGWLLVIILVVAIFNADKLPDLKKLIETKTKEGVEAVKKGQQKAQEKLAQVKEAKAKKEESKKNEE
ncbi:MAG: hypothetical protein IJ019_06230 [Alphaproteobacteria bacterium]|nr:hypothetical protein [Alphaproteobacteria bacterium]